MSPDAHTHKRHRDTYAHTQVPQTKPAPRLRYTHMWKCTYKRIQFHEHVSTQTHKHILWALHYPAWRSEFMKENLTYWPLQLNVWLFITRSACSLPHMYLRLASSEVHLKAQFLDPHRPFSFGFPSSSRWVRTISWNSGEKMKVWVIPAEVND